MPQPCRQRKRLETHCRPREEKVSRDVYFGYLFVLGGNCNQKSSMICMEANKIINRKWEHRSQERNSRMNDTVVSWSEYVFTFCGLEPEPDIHTHSKTRGMTFV